jgi:hypothetical protein
MNETKVLLTVDMLRKLDACEKGIERFRELFGEGGELVWSPLAYLMAAKLEPQYLRWLVDHGLLDRPSLSGFDLCGVDLSESDLISSNFRGANLRGANLVGSNLWGCDLRGADLSHAFLLAADMGAVESLGASFDGADLTGAWFYMGTVVPPGWQENNYRLSRL